MGEMASQCSELWPQQKACSLKPEQESKFKLRWEKASNTLQLLLLWCQSELCDKAHNKEGSLHGIHSPLHTRPTARNDTQPAVGKLYYSPPHPLWLCLLYRCIKKPSSDIAGAQFNSNPGQLFVWAHGVKRPSKGCVRERNAGIHPHPTGHK